MWAISSSISYDSTHPPGSSGIASASSCVINPGIEVPSSPGSRSSCSPLLSNLYLVIIEGFRLGNLRNPVGSSTASDPSNCLQFDVSSLKADSNSTQHVIQA